MSVFSYKTDQLSYSIANLQCHVYIAMHDVKIFINTSITILHNYCDMVIYLYTYDPISKCKVCTFIHETIYLAVNLVLRT